MPAYDVPVFVKHVALAIYKDGYGHGSVEDRFYQAFDAARWKGVEWGYLREGSQYGPPENIKLTARGRGKETYHRRESDGAIKNKQFIALYERIEAAVEEPEEAGADNAEAEGSIQEYRARMQARRAKAAAAKPRPQRPRSTKRTRGRSQAKKARTRRAKRRRR